MDGIKTNTYQCWNEFNDEPYVCVPLALWDNFLIDNLKKVRDGLFTESGEVSEDGEIAALKALLIGLVGFCQYCKDEHTD